MENRYCQYCGKKINPNSQFCPYCGKEINKVNLQNNNVKEENTEKSKNNSKLSTAAFVFSIISCCGILSSIFGLLAVIFAGRSYQRTGSNRDKTSLLMGGISNTAWAIIYLVFLFRLI